MTIGICTYGLHAGHLRDLVVSAEAAGFDAVWVGEHMVVPSAHTSEHPAQPGTTAQHRGRAILDPEVVLADPLVALAAGAGATSQVKVATAIYLLPLRHPLVTARAAATLADLSGGRLVLGVGSGWLAEEFAALDVPYDQRRGRYEEALDILRLALAGGACSYEGTHFRFEGVQVTPHPVSVPIVLGGNTPVAIRRAAERGDGWITSSTPDFATARTLHAQVGEAVERAGHGRPFRSYVRVAGLDASSIERYRSQGMDDLLIWAHQIWEGIDQADPVARHEAVLAAGDRLGLAPVA